VTIFRIVTKRRGRPPWIPLIAVAFTVGLDVAGGACLPLLARDPRVTRGATGRISGVLPIGSRADSVTGGTPLPEPAAASLSYGWAPDSVRFPALELTISIPFTLVPEPQAYVQLPRSLTGPLDVGAGAAYSWTTQSALPYLAVGWLDERRSGPLILAGYSHRGYPYYAHGSDPGSLLTTTLGYQFPTAVGTSQVFVQGVLARHDASCIMNVPPFCTPTTRSWSAVAGFSQGITFRRP